MPIDKGEGTPSSASKVQVKISKKWAKMAAAAEAALAANSRAMDDGPLPNDDTLRARGYVSSPGEKLPVQRVGQPLRSPDFSGTSTNKGK